MSILEAPVMHPETVAHADSVARAAELVEQSDPNAYARAYLEQAKLRGKAGITEETVETALANAEAVQPTACIAIRMPHDAFMDLSSEGGKYKTVYETGASRGPDRGLSADHYLRVREMVEKRHGIFPEKGEEYVVYGYLDNLLTITEVTPAAKYGEIAVYLKPEVMARTNGSCLMPLCA